MQPTPHILLLETVHEEAHALLESAAVVRRATGLDSSTVIVEAAECQAIITRGIGRIPAAVLEASPQLRCVARCGVGLDNIDVAAASRRAIAVVHAPDSSTQSVAEHTLGMILALARQMGRLDSAVKEGQWHARDGFRGIELAGKTLGIVGMGRIGRRVAAIGRSLGMSVVSWSPHGRDDSIPSLPFDDLLASADVISLHLALTPETRGVIDASALSRMKPGAILVNTARGALIDETALVEALTTGRLAGAGLDVLDQEPPPPDHPLLQLENVLITPHTAGLTETAYRRMCVETCGQVIRILQGEEPDPGHVFNYREWRALRGGSPGRENLAPPP